MPPHPPNGDDTSTEEVRDLAARTRARANMMDARDVATEALIGVEVQKKSVQGFLGSLSDLHTMYGRLLAETGRLADAAMRGNAANAQATHDAFVRLETLLQAHAEKEEQIFAETTSRIEALEQSSHRPRHRRDPDDSLVDVYEQLPTEVAERVRDSRGRDIDAIVELRDARDATQKQLDELLTEKHEEAIREQAVRDHVAAEEIRLEKRKKARSDNLKFFSLVGGIVVMVVGALFATWQVIGPHIVLHPVAPVATPATSAK